MKKVLTFITIIILISCSSDSSESPNDNLPENSKLIYKIDNGEGAVFKYEGDKIIKGLGNSSADYNEYYTRFQVEYQNNVVKRVYYQESVVVPKPANFSFDLTDGTYDGVTIYDYNYVNNKLGSISVNGDNYITFNYDSQGRINEEISIGGSTKYFYDNNGKVASYYELDGSESYNGSFVTDEKINPVYILWKKYNFVFPPDISLITNFNTRFFPNNKVMVYNGEQVKESVTMTYNSDNFPITYKIFNFSEYIEYLD